MSEKPSPSRPPDQQQAVRELYSNRNFKLLWTGQLLSQIGDQCLLIAAITLISNLSRSPLTLLIPAISMAIPQLIFFAFAPNYTIVLASITVIGACIVMARGALDTIAQTLSPDAVRGRVQSAINMIVVAATAMAEGLSALLGSLIAVQTVFVMAGVVTMLAGVAAAFVLRGAARLMRQVTVT